jgi:hypothetical protein
METVWAIVAGLVSLGVLLGGLSRFLHIGQTAKHLRLFLLDWLGEPERPGVEARPSFPERMAKVERRTETLQHDFATETTSRLMLIGETVDRAAVITDENHNALSRVDFRLNGIDQRINDHRRRNDEQIESLRLEVERRVTLLGPNQAQSAMMHAALSELGMDIDLNRPPDPPDVADHQG